MSFEGFNQIVKQATEISNYRSEDVFVMEYWVMKSAKQLRKVQDAGWVSFNILLYPLEHWVTRSAKQLRTMRDGCLFNISLLSFVWFVYLMYTGKQLYSTIH